MTTIERRKHHRVKLPVAVSCVSIDSKDTPLNFNMGVIRDVSQSGAALEIVSELASEFLLLAFVDTDRKTYEIKAQVMNSRMIESGKTIVGIKFLEASQRNIDFITKLVQFYNRIKKS